MIEPSELTIEYLATILDDAAVDYDEEEDKHLYVTSTEFNMWVKRNVEKDMIVFTTYWKLRENVKEVNALRLANRCNATLIPMCQFYVDDDVERLNGAFGIDTRYGLNRRQFLRSIRQFSQIFAAAVQNEDKDMILMPWRQEVDSEGEDLVLH